MKVLKLFIGWLSSLFTSEKRQEQVPCFEGLEPRQLMSVTVSVQETTWHHDDGTTEVYETIYVEGDDSRDKISVEMRETWEGPTVLISSGGMSFRHSLENVLRLDIETGGGNDKIDILAVGIRKEMYVDVNAGDGNDRINFRGSGLFNPNGEEARFQLHGGDGNDRINLRADKYIFANGGDGNDRLTARGDGSQLADFSYQLNGGAGNDRLTLINCQGNLYGDDGDDVLNAKRASGGSGLSGGLGKNRLTGSQHADWFSHQGGVDIINALGGSDYVSVNRHTANGGSIRYNGGAGEDTIVAYNTDLPENLTLKSVEVQKVVYFDDSGKG